MPSETLDLAVIDWKDWERSGKALLLENIRSARDKYGSSVINGEGVKSPVPKMIYKLFWNTIHGPVTAEQAVEVCTLLSDFDDEIPSVIMDTVTIFDTEMEGQNSGPGRNKFLKILVLLDEKWCPALTRERLQFETLNEFNKGTKAFHSKFIKLKTKLYYKQNKFNLYREENEGYAKLIMELNKRIDTISILNNVKALIGCFSLDPTRVVDIILDHFQLRPYEVDFFITLLKSYMPETNLLSEVVGFRYLTFLENGVTPKSLHVIVVIMLHYNVLSIDNIYPWLSPIDSEINKELEQIALDEKSKTKPLPSPKSKEEFEKNQKLGLCAVAASLGSWKTFKLLLTRIPKSYVISTPQVAVELCKFVNYVMHPVYVTHSGFSDKIQLPKPDFEVNPIVDPQAKTFIELNDTVFPILHCLGTSLRHDLVLVTKITRILSTVLNKTLKQDPDSKIVEPISLLIQECLLPTLSHLQANCCLSEAIWNVIKLYPLQARYSFYYNWREYLHANQIILDKHCQGKTNVKACMKRVSKENVKQIGRLLGKLSHYSPPTLFDHIINQIQMYDNMIGPVVDSLKYMTNMSYDVLGFCMFDSLYNDTKRPKHDGLNVLPWFQSTSTFCATVFKKYNIDLSGILLYIMDQFKKNESVELLLLKEILQKMTGIEITDEMNQHQIDALSGGELLKAEAGYFIQQQNFKKMAIRLKDALVENNLVAPLGIMLAQQRNYILYHENNDSHLKFLGKLYDECHDTLLQYGAFVSGPIMLDTHVHFPPLHNLLIDYRLDVDTAFYLSRPVLHSLAIDKCKSEGKKAKKTITNMTDAFFEIVDNLAKSIEELYPNKQWDDLSSNFFAVFWALTMNDICVPVQAYQKEIAKHKEQETQPKAGKSEGKNTIADKLAHELKDQQCYSKCVIEHLKKRKTDWFLSKSSRPAKNEMIIQFLQTCIFPRCILSIPDALFCAQFIYTLHTIRTPNFSTLLCTDRLFCDITFSVMTCTEKEASRYGRFLCAVLQNIMRWHSSKEIYDKECANTPGFVTKFRVKNEFSEINDNVHFENYRHLCHKWHYKITRSLLNLLESGDFIQIRNGLTVLIKLLPTFPVIGKLAQFIEKRINKVKEEEKNTRQDLYTLAVSYSGLLSSKSSTWLSESEFHNVSTSTNESKHEDKLEMDSENFNTEMQTDITLSPPSSNNASPPNSPRASSPVKEKKDKKEKEKSPKESSPDEHLDEDFDSDEMTGRLEEGELNRKRSRVRRKSKTDEKDKRKVAKSPRNRSRSQR